MTKRILSKASWKDAIGATKKPKRLKLLSHNELFICPVVYCQNKPYQSKRGCCKHVFTKHDWYHYFEENPDIAKVFPEFTALTNNWKPKWKRVKASNIHMFLKTCVVEMNFKKWLRDPVVEEKVKVRQVSYFAKFQSIWSTALQISPYHGIFLRVW